MTYQEKLARAMMSLIELAEYPYLVIFIWVDKKHYFPFV
jgi:hypothetical protein